MLLVTIFLGFMYWLFTLGIGFVLGAFWCGYNKLIEVENDSK